LQDSVGDFKIMGTVIVDEMPRLNRGCSVRNRRGGWARRFYQFFTKKNEMHTGQGTVHEWCIRNERNGVAFVGAGTFGTKTVLKRNRSFISGEEGR
jgi:hypothetical protein